VPTPRLRATQSRDARTSVLRIAANTYTYVSGPTDY
jgi:hypothetical protein